VIESRFLAERRTEIMRSMPMMLIGSFIAACGGSSNSEQCTDGAARCTREEVLVCSDGAWTVQSSGLDGTWESVGPDGTFTFSVKDDHVVGFVWQSESCVHYENYTIEITDYSFGREVQGPGDVGLVFSVLSTFASACSAEGTWADDCTNGEDIPWNATKIDATPMAYVAVSSSGLSGIDLSVTATPADSTFVCKGTTCRGWFPMGAEITLTAEGGAGCTFTKWNTASQCGTGPTCTLPMDGYVHLVAEFQCT
jgi:hypothetical protein